MLDIRAYRLSINDHFATFYTIFMGSIVTIRTMFETTYRTFVTYNPSTKREWYK